MRRLGGGGGRYLQRLHTVAEVSLFSACTPQQPLKGFTLLQVMDRVAALCTEAVAESQQGELSSALISRAMHPGAVHRQLREASMSSRA